MLNEIIITDFAAFGGTDPYTSATKGVITRPGAEGIGERVDISKNDRVFFRIPYASLIAGNMGSSTVGKAVLFLVPKHVMTWDHSAMPTEDLFKVRKVTTALTLSSCTDTAAMAATLTGDYATIATSAQWLAGQTGYDGSTHSKAIDPWEIDITSLYNDAITNAIDLFFCLECVSVSTKTVVEFFGAEIEAFKPRVEVSTHSALGVTISDINTGMPAFSLSNLSPGTFTGLVWGYDTNYEGKNVGLVNNRLDTMLATSTRVYVKITITYSGVTNTFKRTFTTPKALKPLINPPGYMNAYLDARNPFAFQCATSEDTYGVALKSSSGWKIYTTGSASSGSPFTMFGALQTISGGNWVDLPFLVVDDIGHPYYDTALRSIFFLSCTYNETSGKYDIIMNELPTAYAPVNDNPDNLWCLEDGTRGWVRRTSNVIYSATALPDLKLSTVTRTYTWRNQFEDEPTASLLAAFVADGNVLVYSKSDHVVYPNTTFGCPILSLDYATPWVKEIENATAIDAELVFLHTLTYGRKHRTILAGRHSSGTCLLGTRQDTEQIWDHSSSTWKRYVRNNSGTLVEIGTDTTPLDTPTTRWTLITPANFSAAYATQTAITNMGDHMPDDQTCYVGVVRSSSVTFYTPALAATTPTAFTFNPTWDQQWYDGHILEKWPTIPTKCIHTTHGGYVGLNISGSSGAYVLEAERVHDFLMVSDIASSSNIAVTGTELYAPTEHAFEGMPILVLIGSSGNYKPMTLWANMNYNMLDAPTLDMTIDYSTGSLRVSDFDTSFSTNANAPGLKQLPGHNSFAVSYDFDPGSYDDGVMNAGGWLYFKINNTLGKSLKLSIYQSSIGAGVWINGVFRPYTDAYEGSPELIGGMEWPVCKYDTWWYTYDLPSTPNRKWRRIWDTDLLLDGETNGGTVVLTLPVMTANQVFISHDPVFDVDSYKGTFNEWYLRSSISNDPAYGLVNYTNSRGELLYGGTNEATKNNILSQQAQDPSVYWPAGVGKPTNEKRNLTTWEDEYTGKPGTITGREGDNYNGFVIEDLSVSKADKKLIVICSAEDAEEQTGSMALREIVNELLSGSDIAVEALQSFAFLIIPHMSQAAVRDGFTRYGRDRARSGSTIIFNGPSGWGGYSVIAGEVVKAFVTNWIAERLAARGGSEDHLGVYLTIALHADTHNDPDRVGVGAWPFVTPYVNTTLTAFSSLFRAVADKEFFSTAAEVNNTAYWGSYSVLSSLVTANGGKSMLIELPWRAAAQKGGYWWTL